jgi:hypothetical protein
LRLRPWIPALATAGLVGGICVGKLIAGSKTHNFLPHLVPTGGLSFEVRDGATDQLIPCKLTLTGKNGTPDPQLTHNDVGLQEGNAVVAYNKVMSGGGVGAVHVPFGEYDVTVSRGLEWDTVLVPGVKIDAEGAEVRATLHHAVETPGWVSGDFHVHAARSPDSRVPMLARVYEFLSDGVEVIVATDHNTLSDYAPYIAEVSGQPYLTSIVGDEMTTATWGHFGAFPLPEVLESAGQGAVLVRGRNPKDFFDDVRRVAPEAVIDVHHPRIDSEIGYFNIAKFDDITDEAERPGFSYDFDAIEVVNGYQDPDRKQIDRTIKDWFALLNHGHFVTATGNSDTHHLYYNIGGYPRNYVYVGTNDPAAVKPADIAKALKQHHSFLTTGPILDFTVDGAHIGDVAHVTGGVAHAQVVVKAAPWIAVTKATLFLNGVLVKEWQIPASTAAVRLADNFDIPIGHDSWVVLRVDGDKPLFPVVGDLRRFTVLPLALSNPIFLDFDGDGKITPLFPHGVHTHDPDQPPPLKVPIPTHPHHRGQR